MNPAAVESAQTELQWLNFSPAKEGESVFPPKPTGAAKPRERKQRHKSELLWPNLCSNNEQD